VGLTPRAGSIPAIGTIFLRKTADPKTGRFRCFTLDSHHSRAREMALRKGLNYWPRPRFTTLFFKRDQLAADAVQVIGRMDVEIETSLTKIAEISRRQLDFA